ncbi:MAG: hypothetical protein DRI65_09930 [Chloroflexota bacterium]|nr:MAG: hypothetical protein DRI65_09930 [Chloroflexota bacterium]
MGKGSKRRQGMGYATSKYAQSTRAKGGSWVQDPVTGELIPKSEVSATRSRPNAPYVMGDIEPFQSPITKELITDRGQLRRHNKEHGVTNVADYSPEFISKRSKIRDDNMTGNTRQAQAERRELINRELQRNGI